MLLTPVTAKGVRIPGRDLKFIIEIKFFYPKVSDNDGLSQKVAELSRKLQKAELVAQQVCNAFH